MYQYKEKIPTGHGTVYHWPEQPPLDVAPVKVKGYYSISNRG